MPFPFDEIVVPELAAEATWSLTELFGYLSSWSAAVKFKEARGFDPLEERRDAFLTAWGAGRDRVVRWPLHMRVGQTPPV